MSDTIELIRKLPKPVVDYGAINAGIVEDVWKVLVADKEIDVVNGVRVDELLPFIGSLIKEGSPDFMRALVEQLTDMRNGMCQPGRTIRLCQLILVYYKFDLKE